MKRALITGITGQDGSYLAELLLGKGYEVHGLIRRSSSFNTARLSKVYQDPHAPESNLKLHYGDLADGSGLHALIAKIQPDEVYNLGAQSHVRVSFDQPEYTNDINCLGVVRLLEAIRASCPKARFYQASSSEMFGAAPPPQNEQTPFHPRSPYACAKVHAYHQVINYRESYGLFACNGILFNHECVVSQTPVIIRRNGMIDIVPIDEVVPHRTRPFSKTHKESSPPPDNLEVWDREGWAKVLLRTATWAEHRKIVRLHSRGGYIATTPDHVVFDSSGNELEAGAVAEGGTLAQIDYPKGPGSSIVSEEEALLLGIISGDGSIDRDGGAGVIGHDGEMLDLCERLWPAISGGKTRREFGKSGFTGKPIPKIAMSGATEYGRLIFSELYTEEGFKRVPRRILNATKAVQKSFLTGYNMADGLKRVVETRQEFRRFGTNSSVLAAGLAYLADGCLGQEFTVYSPHCPPALRGYHLNLRSPKAGSRGSHLRRPLDEVWKTEEDVYTGWLFDLETSTGTFAAGVGKLWIHNSPRRGETFVTRKITRAVGRIKFGLQDKLYLGNLKAKRDWGYAGDYVEAMWRMLQQPTAEDFVVATGTSHSIQDFLELAFSEVGLLWENYIQIDPRYFRPAEVDHLEGDASRAHGRLGWHPKVGFTELVEKMVAADLALAEAELALKQLNPEGPALHA